MILQYLRQLIFCKFLKWPFFFISRLVFVDLFAFAFGRSLIVNGPKSDSLDTIRQVAENIAIYAFTCSIFYSGTVITYTLINYIRARRSKRHQRHETISGDRWFYFEEKIMDYCIDKVRHVHFPMDVLNLVYFVFVIATPTTRFQMPVRQVNWALAIVHDFDAADDPAYPDCSLLHAISLRICRKCRAGNRVEIFRTSLFRRKSQSIHSWPLRPKFQPGPNDLIRLRGAQSGGFIFVFVFVQRISAVSISLDIYNMRTKAVSSFDTNVLSHDWSPIYFIRDRVDDELPNTIYVRVIYWSDSLAGHGFGQALFSFNIANPEHAPILISSQVIYLPRWRSRSTFGNIFHRSRGVIGFPVRLELYDHNNTVWRCLCVYDSKEKLVKFVSDFQIFHDDDPNWHIWMERWNDEQNPKQKPLNILRAPLTPVCTPTEVLVFHPDKSIWRTRFRPVSLKNIASKRFLSGKEEKVKDLDEKEWRMATGVILHGHF